MTRPGGERRTVFLNAVSSYGARGLFALQALLLTPYLFRELGAGGFGTWSVMFTLAMVFSLIELGFANGITKLVAELRAREDRAALNETMGTAVAMMAGLGVVGAGFALASAELLVGLAADGEREAFRAGMIVIGLIMPVRFAGTTYGTALIGYGRYDRYNAGQSVLATAFPLVAIVLIEAGGGVFALSVSYAFALLAEALLAAALLRRTDPDVSMRPRFGSKEVRRRIRHLGSYTLLADSMVFIGARMDTILIAGIRNAATAAPFAAALKLQSALQAVALPFVNLLMPMVSELWARGDRERVAWRLALTTRLALQSTLPVALGLSLFSFDLMSLWLGPEAGEETAVIAILLVSTQVVTLTALPAEKALIGIGNVRWIGGLAAIEAVVNLALTIALVILYGAVGAALATLIAYGFLSPVRFPLVARAIDMPVRDLIGIGLWPALRASLPAAAVMVLVFLAVPSGGLRGVVGLAAGISVALIVGVVQVGPRRLRDALRSVVAGGRESEPYPVKT